VTFGTEPKMPKNGPLPGVWWRFPSCCIRLTGSLAAGIWARLIALQIMSFIWSWRWCLGPLLRQHRAWSPRASTALPHGQVCGSQALYLSLRVTATLTASSDSLRPTEAMGGACSQSPERGDAAANSLALSTSPAALENTRASWFLLLTWTLYGYI